MKIVEKMWAAYAARAGGKTFDGKPLPAWEELGEERQSCWIAAGAAASDEIERLREALLPFADIGVPTNPNYEPTIRLPRDAILRARAALSPPAQEPKS